MRHRVLIEAAQRTPDGAGGAATSWTPVASVWAELRDGGGREDAPAGRLEGRRTVTARIRWRDGIVPAMRLRAGGRILGIRAALDEDGRRRFLTLLCEEDTL